MVDTSKFTRRTALGLIGGGVVLTTTETFGFTNVTGARGVSVNVASDSEAILGLLVNDKIKKNKQDRLVDVTNTTDEIVDVTVTLSDCGQGTLYSPTGDPGCSVSFGLDPSGTIGESKTVDIKSGTGGATVSFTITATSPGLSVEATRSTEIVSGNVEKAIEITSLKQFRANRGDNNWTVNEVEAISNADSYELKSVTYEVVSNAGSGDIVGSFEENESVTGNSYSRIGSNNNPAITITPDNGHDIEKKAEYELTITVYDEDGNLDSQTATDKAN